MISAQAIKAAVIGNPVSHSLSPIIHNFLLTKNKIDGAYLALKIPEGDLKSCVKSLTKMGFAGFNVTLPYKENMVQICDFLSKESKLIGAVNTVVIDPNGKLHGYNSDATGFIKNLQITYPKFSLKNKTVFLVGAGGAARAAIYALITANVKSIVITNRSKERPKKLISDFKLLAKKANCELKFLQRTEFESSLGKADLLVNTSAPPANKFDYAILNLDALKKSAIVYDIVYYPLITPLLEAARAQGNKIVTGIGMLIEQAMMGFKFWYGEDFFDGVEVARAELEELIIKHHL